MNRLLVLLLAGVTGVTAPAQTTPGTSGTLRDASGFLPVSDTPAASDTNSLPPANPPALGVASATGGYVMDDNHKLLPGDKVSFQIREDHTAPTSLQVTESSELEIPYVGRVSVTNLTCKQLADEAKALLEKDYYYHATVIIGLDALSKVLGKVYIWGPVHQQGPIEIPANEIFTAGKAILRAGGFGDFADKKNVKIIRKTPNGNVTLKVNMVNVLEKGKTEEDITLEPEDFIIVPQRAINW